MAAVVVFASPDSADNGNTGNNGNGNGPGGNVTLTTGSLPALSPGQNGWVSLNWLGDTRDATSFQVTATEPTGAVTIAYPTNTGSFSAPYRESQLLAAATDYTSFYLRVAPGASGSATVTFHVAYDEQNGNGNGSLKHYTADFPLSLTIVQASGSAVAVVTPSVSVTKATPTWVKVNVTATAAGVTGVHITVAGPAGLVVVYPADGSSSSLNADPNLDKGETDFTGFRLDAAALAAGAYTITLKFDYGVGQTVSRAVSLQVT
ncbi:MAG: hypothetical protein QOI27_3115 [Gaiellaceae bacterium]|nr:hypothetical protein [Gaiellaceae bacterium]